MTCELLSTSLPTLISASAALAGVFVGKWLESRDKEISLKRETLLEVNKFVLVWADGALAKLPFEFGVSEDYLREVSDKALEAKASLEIIGSVEVNLAFDDFRSAVAAMSQKALEYKKTNKLDTNRDIRQFSGEAELEAYRKAKRKWIDAVRKEVGAEPVKL